MKQTGVKTVRRESRGALLSDLLRAAQALGQTFEVARQIKQQLQQSSYMLRRVERKEIDSLAPLEARLLSAHHRMTLSRNVTLLESKARKLSTRELGLKRTIRHKSSRLLESL